MAGKPAAAFICPGHPLLDSVIDLTLEQHRSCLRQGTILIDEQDPSESPRVLFYLDHSIRDAVQLSSGRNRDISRELQFVEVSKDGTMKNAGAAPYLDYRPVTDDERRLLDTFPDEPWLSDNLENKALIHAAQNIVPKHLTGVRKYRDEFIDKTASAVRQRLTREIAHWDHRAQELLAREQAGQTPRINSTMARQRADDLEARLKRRLELLDREKQLSASPPVVIGGALIIPQGLLDSLSHVPLEDRELSPEQRERINRLAVDAVLAAERALGRVPTEMSHYNEGYDIESRDPNEPGRLRFIEVKGKLVGKDTVTVSATQIRYCCNQPDNWILAIVRVDGDTTAQPRYLYGPFSKPPDFAEVGRNFDVNTLLDKSEAPR